MLRYRGACSLCACQKFNRDTKLVYAEKCAICEATERKLIRDHNHETKMIRGVLCDRCNSYVFLFEFQVASTSLEYVKWLSAYQEFVENYIKQDIGIPWNQRLRIKFPKRPRQFFPSQPVVFDGDAESADELRVMVKTNCATSQPNSIEEPKLQSWEGKN
jgi:uncharacterized protein involved in tolerance to divalent cations